MTDSLCFFDALLMLVAGEVGELTSDAELLRGLPGGVGLVFISFSDACFSVARFSDVCSSRDSSADRKLELPVDFFLSFFSLGVFLSLGVVLFNLCPIPESVLMMRPLILFSLGVSVEDNDFDFACFATVPVNFFFDVTGAVTLAFVGVVEVDLLSFFVEASDEDFLDAVSDLGVFE